MNQPAAIGTALVFSRAYQDFLTDCFYAIVAIRDSDFLLVEINLKRPMLARNLRKLLRSHYPSLCTEGVVRVEALPEIPRSKSKKKGKTKNAHQSNSDSEKGNEWENRRVEQLRPLIAHSAEIFSARNPVARFNFLARELGLHVTRARGQFFWWAGFGFDDAALAPAYWNCGGEAPFDGDNSVANMKKRGRPIKDPSRTPSGWSHDPLWDGKMKRGWALHAKPGITYASVYADTLRTQFGCVVQKTKDQARVYQPDGASYPTQSQFFGYIKKTVGMGAWKAAKYGQQTIRNHTGVSINKVSQFLINALEEVQWDAQQLAELPGDLLDPTQPGKPIIRTVATCATVGGPVGVGYDYAAESRWSYLMALLCMSMKKSEFGELIGVDVSDDDWPARGLMCAVRGDRGPAIGQNVTEIIGGVLEIWQEWAASYDPVGKANAEAGHHKTIKVEGAPRKPKTYRSAVEIIRDDIRATVKTFRSADMSHRLDPEQAKRIRMATPRTIWNDLVSRSLYAGQHIALHKMIKLTVPRHPVSIQADGVHLGGLRYLSPELVKSGLLERARGQALASHAYALNLITKKIWLDMDGELMDLIAVPVRINALEATHSLTLEESMRYMEQMASSRRAAEHEQIALDLANKIETAKDHRSIEEERKQKSPYKSQGKEETVRQHQKVFTRKT